MSRVLVKWSVARHALAALALAFFFSLANGRAATNDVFAAGLAAAQAGDFSGAASQFENALKRRPSAGAFVNLGLAEWQRGRAGPAILAWERAAWINPYDPQALQNLEFARTVAQVDAPELRWFEAASTWLPPNAWVWLAGGSLWLAIGALVLPRVLRWRKTGGQQTLAALGCCVFLFSVTASMGVVARTDIGIVVKRNVPLRLTPTSGGELLRTLSAGEPVRRLKARGDYFLVRTATGTGWVEQAQIGLVCE